jgi:hypothetical protein
MRSVKTSPLALLKIIVISILACAPHAVADDGQVAAAPPSIRCAEGHPISIALPETFERAPSNNPTVLCVFRNKSGGFPTFNIVVEPRHEGSKPPTLDQYVEGVTKGYNTVGLTDTKLSNSEAGEIEGVPFFSSDVRFTSNATPMAARILVLQVHDRTYTASAIHRADAADFTPQALSGLTESITVEGVSGSERRTARTSYRAVFQIILVLVVGLYVAVRLVRKKS